MLINYIKLSELQNTNYLKQKRLDETMRRHDNRVGPREEIQRLTFTNIPSLTPEQETGIIEIKNVSGKSTDSKGDKKYK